MWAGMVAHTCDPHYSGGGDGEVYGLRPVRAKSLQDPVSTNGWVYPSYMGKPNRRHKVRSYLKNNQHKHSGRVTQVVEHLANTRT
jgi:hypothetical protein